MNRAAAICLCVSLSLSRPLNAQDSAPTDIERSEQNANDEWARALWLSLPLSRASDAEVTAQFLLALKLADSKAPIYVSMGDAAAQLAYRQSVEDAFDSVQEEFASELRSELEQKLPPINLEDEEQVKAALKESLENSYSVLARNDATLDAIGKLVDASDNATSASVAYYLAAVAEDSNYLPAWFKLTKFSEGDAFDEFAQHFREDDPDNALPHYMIAGEHVRRNELDAALEATKAGNTKPNCRWYPAEFPAKFDLRYPQSEFLEQYEAVGEPMTAASLLSWRKRLEDLSAHEDPLHRSLRMTSSELVERAKVLRRNGRLRDSVDTLEAVRRMGYHLITVEPQDGLIMVTGLDVASSSYGLLREAYSDLEADAKITALDASQERLNVFRTEFSKALADGRPTEEDVKLILLGEKNVVEEERIRLRQALVDSGIIEADDASD